MFYCALHHDFRDILRAIPRVLHYNRDTAWRRFVALLCMY